jgi:dipeptidyl aminopeptidase/acylaminoacyl peptidase
VPLVMALVGSMPATPGTAQDALIPLHTLLGPPRILAPQLSPDGSRVCWIAESEGAPDLWVAPVDTLSAARAVTHERGRGLQPFDVSGNGMIRWSADGRRLIYRKDHDGDEQWNWWVLDLASNRAFNATPRAGASVQMLALSDADPCQAVVGINDRDPAFRDLWRVDLATGAMTRVMTNDRFAAVVVDRQLRPRVGVQVTAEGGLELWRSAGDSVWTAFDRLPPGEPAGEVVGFDAAGTMLYARSSRDRNTAALVAWDLAKGTPRTLAADARVDVGRVLVDPVSGRPQAYVTNWTRKAWHALDAALAPDLDTLAARARGEFDVLSRSRDDRRWLVRFTRDDGPEEFLLYERPAHTLRTLAVSHPQLTGLPLTHLVPVVLHARDSLEIVSYVALPRWTDPDGDGVPNAPLPTVMLVHGGPGDERAEWGFAPLVQWLCNRGYAVLDVNFRGSPGFGKAFQAAERHEWGGKMSFDLEDQARWAVARGIADRTRIAILGGSYGGYAALCGLTMTPGVFACAIDVVGPANLLTFMSTIPPTWSLDHFAARIGDPRTEEGRALLRARSPIHFLDRVHEPLLVAQGAHDARVPQAESDSLVAALERRHVPVTYLLYPDEGHGFERDANATAFYAVTEAFLSRWLGGRCEPLTDQLDASSVLVPTGVDRVPGLMEALARRGARR